MKSAYAVLGIPGNASQAEIDQAFHKATRHYSRDRLVDDPEAITRLADVNHAHKLLSSADMRAAHDRKLDASLLSRTERPRVVIGADPPAWYIKPMIIMALLVFGMFAIGGYMSHSRNQMRKALAEQELAQKKQEAEAVALAEAQQAKMAAERARAEARAESQERQLRAESSAIARTVAYSNQQQESQAMRQIENERRDKQRRENEIQNDERRRVSEAQRRLAADKQRIRELCYQQYRQSNC
jgi:curved DNA-binding protein CbpA